MRRLFLGRPAFLLYAAASAVIPFLLLPDAVQAVRAVHSDDLTVVEDARVEHQPSRNRSVNEKWNLYDGSEHLDTFEVSPGDGRLLAYEEDPGDRVTARLYDGEVVDVTAADGTVVRSLEVGVRGAALDVILALVGVAGVIGFGGIALGLDRQRMEVAAGAVLAFALPSALLVSLGLPWAVSVGLTLAALVALVVLSRRSGRRDRALPGPVGGDVGA